MVPSRDSGLDFELYRRPSNVQSHAETLLFKVEVLLPCGGTVYMGASEILGPNGESNPQNALMYPSDFQDLRPVDLCVALKGYLEELSHKPPDHPGNQNMNE